MSQENIDVVRRAIDHSNETGELAWDLYDPEVSFTTRGEFAGRGTYRGHEGLERGMAAFAEVWEEIHAEVLELVDGDEALVAVTRFHLRSRAGVELDVDEGWAYWLRNGKILRIEQHASKREALEAVGLSE